MFNNTTIWELISYSNKIENNNIAFELCSEKISYKQLINTINIISNTIKKLYGICNKITIINNKIEYDAICFLGVVASNNIAIPISLKYGNIQCENILRESNPNLIITTDIECLHNINIDKNSNTTSIVINNKKYFFIYMNNRSKDKELNDVASIIFTSGTTGTPKGVMLTHNNLITNIKQISNYFNILPSDNMLIIRSISHIAVVTGELLIGLYKGCTISFYSDDFNPRTIINKLEKNNISILCGTPTLFYYLSRFIKKKSQVNLRLGVLSGECLKHEICYILKEKFPTTNFFNVYGLTEASPRLSFLHNDNFFNKVGSVGKVLEGIEICIKNYVDIEKNIGEICVKGENVFKGYYNNKELTRNKKINGWLYTGDIGYIDNDGDLFVLGRKDNMIIKFGINIYPEVIENSVLSHEEIKAALVWCDETKFNKSIVLNLVREENSTIDKKSIFEFLTERLDTYMLPNDIVFVENLSYNSTGKLIRKK